MNNAVKKFSIRAFVSVMTAVSFVMMALSGLILYAMPHGHGGHWANFKIFGLGNDQWQDMHICFSIVFIIVSIFHIYYNWRALLNYFKAKLTKKFAFKLEWALAVILCIVIYIGTYKQIVPFSSILEFGQYLSHSLGNR